MLPPSRTLAADLGLARNTVAEAYAELIAEGWLASRQGAGTWVVNTTRHPSPTRPRGTPGASPVHNLHARLPRRAAFPRSAWLASARRALTAAPNEALRTAMPRGRPELREALAEYLARVRGVRASPETSSSARAPATASNCWPARSPPPPATDRRGGLRAVPVPRRDRRDGRRHRPDRIRRARRQGRRTRPPRRLGGAADARPLLPARRPPARGPTHRAHRLGAPHRPLPTRGRLRRRVPLRPPAHRGGTGPRPAARGLPRVGEQEPVARAAAGLDGTARRPRRTGHRRGGRPAVLRQRHRPTDHGGLHHRRPVRQAHPPHAHRLPTAP